MQRGLWTKAIAATRRVPRRSPRRSAYSNHQILAVLLWAVLHNKPIVWACDRSNWPRQAWRRRLPNQSTMSRRMRDPELQEELELVLEYVQRSLARDGELYVDGKPLELSENTRDPDASTGRVVSGYGKGYRAHVIMSESGRVAAHTVEPMNVAECTTATALVAHADVGGHERMRADASYDSSKFYAACASRGVRLIAQRRKPGTGVSKGHKQHSDRLRAIEDLEGDPVMLAEHKRKRGAIERFFGALVSWGCGLSHLPTWVRRLYRVRLWVAAKLVFNAARIVLLKEARA